MVNSGASGKLIHEKNQKQKTRDTVPLKGPPLKIKEWDVGGFVW